MSRQSSEEQLAFVMACLKSCGEKPKPNFIQVAEELGLSATTCYHRHWRMMKDWGVSDSRAAGAGSATAALGGSIPATPSGKAKRGRPKGSGSKKPKNNNADVRGNASDTERDDEDNATPSKKLKTERLKAEGKDGKVKMEIHLIDDDENGETDV